jgi:hypothetical protein
MLLSMHEKSDHPFCIDVRASRVAPDRFGWRIMTKGGQSWRSTQSYGSFELARRAGQARLGELVEAWRLSLAAAA